MRNSEFQMPNRFIAWILINLSFRPFIYVAPHNALTLSLRAHGEHMAEAKYIAKIFERLLKTNFPLDML